MINNVCVRTGLFQRIFTIFSKHEDVNTKQTSLEEVISNESDKLWEMLRKRETEGLSDSECRDIAAASFECLRNKYTDEELDKQYVWSRFVKISVYISSEPINGLIEYVNESNYIYHTKQLSDLSKSIFKSDEEQVARNMELFMDILYRHILDDINPKDIPSCLALGRLEQKRENYDAARDWFLRAIETDNPFNGITALLACNEAEIKEILADGKKHEKNKFGRNNKINELKCQQRYLYDTWSSNLEKNINEMKEGSEDQKSDYVSLMTRYARFERNCGNYHKAFEILEKIPESYPEIHRVYTEKAMIYQFKSSRNSYYNLDNAIIYFIKADSAIYENQVVSPVDVKARKSILVPLANSYFWAGRYQDAADVCDIVLKLDSSEKRAVKLKNRIKQIASS